MTISDTLGAPEVAGPDAAVRASEAGVDMLLYTDESASERAYTELVAAVKHHVLSAARVMSSAVRIHALTAAP